jgi:hypothetical protein
MCDSPLEFCIVVTPSALGAEMGGGFARPLYFLRLNYLHYFFIACL